MLVVFIVSIVGFIGFFYYQTVKTNRINITKLTENQLAYASKKMLTGQEEIEDNAGMILIDDTVKKIRNFPGTRKDPEYLQALLDVKKMLKERLINGDEMASITVYWPKKEVLISTETNLGMHEEMQSTLGNGKEWRETTRGLYFFMNYSFGNIDNNDTVVAVEMSDSLLMEIQESVSIQSNDTIVILPGQGLIGGSKKLQQLIVENRSSLKDKETNQLLTFPNSPEKLLMNRVPNSDVVIATLLPISDNDKLYTRNTVIILSSIVFITLFGGLLIFFYYRNVISEITLFTSKLKEVEQGNYDTRIEATNNNEFGYLFEQFNQMVSSLQKLLRSLSIEMKQRELAEEKQFQSQIQPHFLYNSLFYIVSVADDQIAVTEMTRHLAEYYRYLTKKLDVVTVGEEVKFARDYLIVQSLRKEFEFEIHLTKDAESLSILPLLIQPLIENAIVHGIESWDNSQKIILNIFTDDKYCHVEIQDDGTGMTHSDIQKLMEKINLKSRRDVTDSVGLWNVNQRLINYYGKNSRLSIQPSILGGLNISFFYKKEGGITENETINR